MVEVVELLVVICVIQQLFSFFSSLSKYEDDASPLNLRKKRNKIAVQYCFHYYLLLHAVFFDLFDKFI